MLNGEMEGAYDNSNRRGAATGSPLSLSLVCVAAPSSSAQDTSTPICVANAAPLVALICDRYFGSVCHGIAGVIPDARPPNRHDDDLVGRFGAQASHGSKIE